MQGKQLRQRELLIVELQEKLRGTPISPLGPARTEPTPPSTPRASHSAMEEEIAT
eukprot:SAG11_NODE_30407_length_301_cov_0.772277_1_plen_54_part_10